MRLHYRRIGDYVTLVKLKNTDGTVSSLKGININKHFMPSVANVNGTDLNTYRVVKKNQFAFNPMHVGRDEVLPISMLEDDNPIIVSPAYVVFEVKDEEELLPAYLMMWCRRSEFDRNAWFMTDNSVRGGFSWADFCNMELPIPSIEKQREIVREYNVVNGRIALNEQLIQKLEDAAQTIYKQWFVDFEFPISKEYAESMGKPELEGEPYKSSGGEMKYCDIFDKEIPSHWCILTLSDVGDVVTGKTPPSSIKGAFGSDLPFITPTDYKNYKKCAFDSIRKLSEIGGRTLNNKLLPPKSLLVTCIGSDMGKVVVNEVSCITNQQINALIPHQQHSEFLYYLFEDMYEYFRNIALGSSTMPMINKKDFEMIKIIYPISDILDFFESKISMFTSNIMLNKKQSYLLRNLNNLLLQKMTDV